MSAAEQRERQPPAGAERFPLSPAQEGFWLLDALHPGHAGSNEQFAIFLDGELDVASLGEAWRRVAVRHETLRLRIVEESGKAWQRVAPERVEEPQFIDLGATGDLRELATRHIREPFDLRNGPLYRAVLLRLGASSHALLITVHHVAADGLSVPVIRDDLAACYAALRAGEPADGLPPAPRYCEFAARERERLTDVRLADALGWWRAQLAGAPPRHALPQFATGRATPGEARRIAFSVDAATVDRLRGVARSHGVTLFTLLLAAFRALVVRYSAQDDVLISSPVTAREDPATRRMVGCLINNAVFRTSAGGDPTFAELLARERSTLFGVLEHREVPFGRVVEALGLARRPGEQPLSQILFQFDSPAPPRLAAGVSFRIEPVHADRHSWWDLEWAVADRGAGRDLGGHLCYSTARFEDWMAESMPRHFATLLAGIAADPLRRLSELPLLDDVQRQRLLVECNATARAYPERATLHGLVEEQCRRSPEAIALTTGAGELRYGELAQRVAAAAARLAAMGVAPGDLVGLCLPAGVNLVVGLLAILRAGAAVVPLDPGYPRDRLEFMLRDSGARVLIAGPAADLDAGAAARLDLDGIDVDGAASAVPPPVTPESPCWVLYTSGSTGEPKGAVGLHRGAVNRCHWMWREYGFGPDDVFCLRTSINFVDAYWEIFGALIHGIPLAILPGESTRDPALLVPALARHRVTQLVLVPPLLGALLDTTPDLGERAPALRTIVTSGEPLSTDLHAAVRRHWPGVRLLNTYGTSEIWDATCCDTSLLAEGLRRIPIGRPIANVRCYVLDRQLRPLPPGVPGELCVAGAGIGAGYWRRPALTAERFVADPFSTDPQARLYRSGDLARFLPDGSIECLGRMDRQLKLRGYRLEPGEIEAALRECEGVADAAVVLREDGGEPRLVAYVADGGAGVEVESLQRALRRLPAFMQPSAWVVLAALPLTPSGKVDRAALPAPAARQRAPSRPAVDALEARLVALCSAVLGGAEVGPDDSFFDLGGQSLSAMRLLSRVGAACGVTLTLREFFDEPTAAGLAARIRARGGSAGEVALPLRRDPELPLSLGQERLWFLDQLDPASPAYNLAWTITIEGEPDLGRLQRALDAVVARHESLRTAFPAREGRPAQLISTDARVVIGVEQFAAGTIEERLHALAREPFDLATGPLLRATLLDAADGRRELLLVIHHAISDGTSNAILFRELCEHYGRQPGAPSPAPLPVQYADFASWQRRWLAGPRTTAQLDYWAQRLAGAPPALELPADFPRPAEQRFRGAWVWRSLPAGRAGELRAFAARRDCTLYMVMLAAFKALAWRYSGQDDLLVGTPVSARPHPDLEGLIGLFVNTVVLRTSAAGDPAFEEFLVRVRAGALEAFDNQDAPFERVVERLAPPRTLARAPVFQLMFNLVPIPQRLIVAGGVGFRLGRLLDHGVSTFDLTLTVGEHAAGLELVFEFDTDLFRRDSIERLADAYLALLDAIQRDPARPISELTLPDPGEAARSGALLAGTAAHAPARETALTLFAHQAAVRGAAEAVRASDGALAYAALQAQANRIAHWLLQRGCGRGDRVGICLPRTTALPAAVLGTLQAGAAYVPLDPDYPPARLREMASEAALAAVVLSGSAIDFGVPALDLGAGARSLAALPATAPDIQVHPEDAAYVVFTSGSTGRAKGVVVTHASLAATFRGWESVYALTAQDTHLQMASAAFDVFSGDLARALFSGARLVLCPREDLLDPPRLHALLARERVTVAEFVPAVMRPLLAWMEREARDLGFMRLVAVGSEAWYGHEYRALKARCGPQTRVVNSYGVAEATIDSAWFEAEAGEDVEGVLPIGRPFPQATLCIVDERLRMLPVGVPGELVIGGAGVAAGYWGRDELTAGRFVADPLGGGARAYRTGDRARLRADGRVEYLGRLDEQVKVRGYRIEPGEVEAALAGCSGVAGCAVGVREAPGGDRRLVAWVVADGAAAPDATRLRAELRRLLPDHLVPSAFVAVASLPLTGNGKVDRRALPAPEWGAHGEAADAGPRDALDAALAGLFAEVLGSGRAPGIHEDFFALGGHSLLATQLVSRIRDALGLELPLRWLFECPTVAGLAARLRPGRSAEDGAFGAAGPTYEAPLSFAQQRLWFLEQLEELGPVYNVRLPLRLRGVLDATLLQAAVDRLVARHEALRTTIRSRDGKPVQAIAATLQVPVEHVRMDGAAEPELRRRVAQLASRVFDLARGPLLRVALIRVAPDDHVLLVVTHHVISDAWSSGVLFRDLAAIYVALREGREPALAELEVQYADFANWQRDWLQGEELARQVGFWKQQLAGAPPLLDLPTDRPRPAVQSYAGSRWTHILPRDFTQRLRACAAAEGCTLFMVLLGGFAALLARYAGQDEVVVGTPVAGRHRTELESVVGLFANTLAMRVDLAGDPSLRELLARVRRTSLAAWAHQDLPFEKLVEALQPVRSLSHAPLFQVMFILQNTPWEAAPIPGLEVTPAETDAVAGAKFDLTLSATEYEGEIWLGFEYGTALFDEATIERLARHYEALLRGALAAPASALADIALEEATDRGLVLGPGEVAETPAAAVHELVLAQARRCPRSVAIEGDGRQWTYAELDAFAGSLAARLRRLGARPGEIVALCLERSPEMIGCILGVLRSGAAYLPLDPAFPDARTRFMLEDSGARFMLTSRALGGRFGALDVRLLCVEDLGAPGCGDATPAGDAVAAGDLAYLIYTSGSTGRPKGVRVTHGGVVNFLASMLQRPGLSAADRLLAVTTLCFDIAVLELLGPVAAGGTVVLASAEEARDGAALARRIAADRITVMQATPVTWRALLAAGWRGSAGLKALCGGEALDAELAGRLLAAGVSLWNMYGPTETTIWSTCGEVRDPARIDVGRPIANTQVYVLDARRRPTPPGLPGELCIGGAGVAAGYHRRAELTAERFVADPFNVGARLYRTGDRARFLADGRLQVLGRLDEQVKIRGFRIEPGEVEACLLRCDGVAAAAVGVREATPGDRRLVAWIETRAGASVSAGALREQLRSQLPDYFVPAAFVLLERLPLTANGKLDRKALPAPDWGGADDAYVPPRNAVEETIAGLFAELLGSARAVGIHDDFFALGGHSLLATQLTSRIRDTLGLEIPLKKLFESPTVAGLSAGLDGASLRAGGVRPRESRAAAPLSYPQQRLWFLEQLDPGNAAYHLHASFRLRGPLDVTALQGALDALVARHEVLRTRIEARGGEPVQVIAAPQGCPLERLDATGLDEAALARRLAELVAAPFDFGRGPLFRAALLERGGGDWRLLLVIHHIIADGWSIGVLLRELSAGYDAALRGAALELPPLPVQYADFAQWQREWLAGGELERQLGYWREQLAGAPPAIHLPTDRPRPPVQRHRGGWHTRVLPASLGAALTALAQRERATLFMVLVSAYAALLSRYTGDEEVLIGTPIAGRSRTELEGLIGFFVNTLVLRTDLRGAPRFRELLARTRRAALDAYANAEVPFERLVDALNPPRDPGRTPLFQVMFNLHSEPRHPLRLAGVEVHEQALPSPYSKFDLNLHVALHDGALVAGFGYNTDLLDAQTIEWLAESYEKLLAGVAAITASADVPVGELDLLGPAQGAVAAAEAARLTPGQGAAVPIESGGTLAARFAAQAQRHGGRPALGGAGGQWSYAALDERARAVAHALLAQAGARAGRVALLLGHDAVMVAGLLGAVLAGKAYVPLDPYAPRARHEALLRDAGVQAIVTDGARLLAAAWLRESALPVVLADAPSAPATGARLPQSQPQDPAYLLYTSGSTGRPKAVVQSQRNVLGQVDTWCRQLAITADDRLSLFSGYGYDAAVQDIFGALLNGASVHPLDLRGGDSAPELVDRIAAGGITILHATPTVYRYLFGGRVTCQQDLSAVRLVVLGGEEARRSDLDLFKVRFRRGARFVNGLGLTESTMAFQYVADHDTRTLGDRLPIGRPVPGNRFVLLDEAGRPDAWKGEVALYSPHLAEGYHGDEALSAARFPVRDGERWLLTGDLARRLPDGQLLYLGRKDRQVKIRGIRVEPAEIEALLAEATGEAAVVVAREQDEGTQLVAYVVTSRPLDEPALRASLRARLPESLVPAAFVPVPALPRLANGKIDLDALPAPDARPAQLAVPPRNEIEQRLAGLWSGVLKREDIGVHDDFFALGGHSLLATRLIARIRDAFGLEVPLIALFESPTIAGLAVAVERTARTVCDPAMPALRRRARQAAGGS
jgi:amino acid adenylation domain-containing protein